MHAGLVGGEAPEGGNGGGGSELDVPRFRLAFDSASLRAISDRCHGFVGNYFYIVSQVWLDICGVKRFSLRC